MRLHRTSALWVGTAITCLWAVVAMAAEVRDALDRLKAAPPQEQLSAWQDVVDLGDAALDPLIVEVAAFRQTEDRNYMGLCVLALAELKSDKATDGLIDVLLGSEPHLSYLAAQALGATWEGRGPGEQQSKVVNAALLGAMYAGSESMYVLGPGLAFLKVDSIPLPKKVGGRRVMSAEGLQPHEIIAIIEEWLAANPGALCDVDQQPWALNLRTALNDPDPAARDSAIQALRRKRDLAPVEPLLAALATQDPAPDDLAQLLSDLTGMRFPPADVDPAMLTSEELAAYWRGLWLAVLSSRTDQKHIDYVMSELQANLRRLREEPSDAAAARVNEFRMVVMRQFSDAAAIPGGASAAVKKLLEKPLATKLKIDAAVSDLEGNIRDYDKQTRLEIIRQQTNDLHGREVGALFLGRLVVLARKEQTQTVARQIGEFLSHISGIPCQLDFDRPETRQARLEQWVQEALGAGIYLEGI